MNKNLYFSEFSQEHSLQAIHAWKGGELTSTYGLILQSGIIVYLIH